MKIIYIILIMVTLGLSNNYKPIAHFSSAALVPVVMTAHDIEFRDAAAYTWCAGLAFTLIESKSPDDITSSLIYNSLGILFSYHLNNLYFKDGMIGVHIEL